MIDNKVVIITEPAKIKEIREALELSYLPYSDLTPALPSPLPENAAEMWFGHNKAKNMLTNKEVNMVTLKIVATEKRAYAQKENDENVIVCPIVKESSGKYSVNIKKLGFGKSFVNIGDLEDKVVTLEENSLVAGRSAGRKRKAPSVTVPEGYEKFLSADELTIFNTLVEAINAGFIEEIETAKAANKPKSELGKIAEDVATAMGTTYEDAAVAMPE